MGCSSGTEAPPHGHPKSSFAVALWELERKVSLEINHGCGIGHTKKPQCRGCCLSSWQYLRVECSHHILSLGAVCRYLPTRRSLVLKPHACVTYITRMYQDSISPDFGSSHLTALFSSAVFIRRRLSLCLFCNTRVGMGMVSFAIH